MILKNIKIPWNRIPFGVYILITIFFCSNPFSLLDFPLDDAWIHRVYSQSFAFGNGFEYNAGQQEAGSTSPLWSIVTAPVHWLEPLGTNTIVLGVKLIGTIFALLSILAIKKIAEKFNVPPTVSYIPALIYAMDPRLVFSALSGMESILLVCLWLWSLIFLLDNRRWLPCLLISLTPTVRPESLIIIPIFALAYLISHKESLKMFRSYFPLLILPLPMLAWGLFCHHANGHWLPNTFYLKSTGFAVSFNKLIQAWKTIGYRGLFPSSISMLLILLWLFTKRYSKEKWTHVLLALLAPLAFTGGVIFNRNFLFDGYYWTRWVEAPALILSGTTIIGATIYFNERIKKSKPSHAIILAISIALASLFHSAQSLALQRYHLINDSRAIFLINVQAGKWVNDHIPKSDNVAVNDAGALKYFGKRNTIDCLGLNNANIAFNKNINRGSTLLSADWAVIFPSWFKNPALYKYLKPVAVFSIPPEEYTVCNAPGQNQAIAFKVTHP